MVVQPLALPRRVWANSKSTYREQLSKGVVEGIAQTVHRTLITLPKGVCHHSILCIRSGIFIWTEGVPTVTATGSWVYFLNPFYLHIKQCTFLLFIIVQHSGTFAKCQRKLKYEHKQTNKDATHCPLSWKFISFSLSFPWNATKRNYTSRDYECLRQRTRTEEWQLPQTNHLTKVWPLHHPHQIIRS